MTGALNTQAEEFPTDPPIENIAYSDASEYRDIDIATTVNQRKTTEYSSVLNESMTVPHDTRAEAREERRTYANGPDTMTAETVSEMGTRRYSAFTVNAFPGVNGYAGAPVLLLGEDRSRVRIVISNSHATQDVRIGPRSDVENGSGLAIPSGVLFETNVTEPIYACVPVGVDLEVIAVGVWAEYV